MLCREKNNALPINLQVALLMGNPFLLDLNRKVFEKNVVTIPTMKKVDSGFEIAIVEKDPLYLLKKSEKFKTGKQKKIKHSQDYPVMKKKRNLSISISAPVSPSLRGQTKKVKSAPVSPIICGVCITPPNSPSEYDLVVEGRWMFVGDI